MTRTRRESAWRNSACRSFPERRSSGSEEEALKAAEKIGYPVMVKASAGGGGKGMRIINSAEELPTLLQMAQNEAEASFGSSAVYLEKYISSPRHIEFQVMADQHGKVIHLGERECTIQRRHQKVLEESPSTQIELRPRREMGGKVIRALRSIGYHECGYCRIPDG